MVAGRSSGGGDSRGGGLVAGQRLDLILLRSSSCGCVVPQVVSPYEVTFMDSFTWRSLCKEDLTEQEVSTHHPRQTWAAVRGDAHAVMG